MSSRGTVFDDMARVASSALGVAAGMREEVEQRLREQFERWLAQMDVVSREEFEAMAEVAARARAGQEELEEKMTALAARVEALEKAAKPAPRRRKAATPKSTKDTSD